MTPRGMPWWCVAGYLKFEETSSVVHIIAIITANPGMREKVIHVLTAA